MLDTISKIALMLIAATAVLELAGFSVVQPAAEWLTGSLIGGIVDAVQGALHGLWDTVTGWGS